MLSTRIAEKRRIVSERMVRAERRIERLLAESHKRISNADVAMRGVPARLTAQTRRFRDQLANLTRHSDTAIRHRLSVARGAITAQDRVLQSLSYKNVLKRGYAVVRDDEERPVSLAAALSASAAISIEFADGRVSAVTGEGLLMPPAGSTAPVAKKRPAKPADPVVPAASPKQGSLF
jgi:exodeoxyribonuclease VII large subunit